jgi:hypothetical protein
MADKRAIREFSANGDVWKVADEWAAQQGYKAVDESADRRVYKKGSGFFTGARAVELRTEGNDVHLEAWVIGNLPARVLSLFILPAEITVESGGAKAVVPRKQGRAEVNELLSKLNQEPIG